MAKARSNGLRDEDGAGDDCLGGGKGEEEQKQHPIRLFERNLNIL